MTDPNTDTIREPLVTIRELYSNTAKDGWKLSETSMTVSGMTIDQFMSLNLDPIRVRQYNEGVREAARRNADEGRE